MGDQKVALWQLMPFISICINKGSRGGLLAIAVATRALLDEFLGQFLYRRACCMVEVGVLDHHIGGVA